MKTDLIKEPEKNSENDSFPRFYQCNGTGRIWSRIAPDMTLLIYDPSAVLIPFSTISGETAGYFPPSIYTRIIAPFTIRFVP